jgi:hypothetical protein
MVEYLFISSVMNGMKAKPNPQMNVLALAIISSITDIAFNYATIKKGSWQGKEFPLFHKVQTSSGANQTFCPMSTGDLSPRTSCRVGREGE